MHTLSLSLSLSPPMKKLAFRFFVQCFFSWELFILGLNNMFSRFLLGSTAVPLDLRPSVSPPEGVSPLLMCRLKTLSYLQMCCSEVRALGDVLVNLGS